MNMRIEPLSLGRETFCGSGQGGSDCIAARVTPDGRIMLSNSHDENDPPREIGPFGGHELMQLAEAVVNDTAPPDVLAAIYADLARQPA